MYVFFYKVGNTVSVLVENGQRFVTSFNVYEIVYNLLEIVLGFRLCFCENRFFSSLSGLCLDLDMYLTLALLLTLA